MDRREHDDRPPPSAPSGEIRSASDDLAAAAARRAWDALTRANDEALNAAAAFGHQRDHLSAGTWRAVAGDIRHLMEGAKRAGAKPELPSDDPDAG